MLDNQLKKQAQLRESVLAAIVMLALCYAAYINFYTPQKKLSDEFTTTLTEVEQKKTGIQKLIKALQVKYKKLQTEMIRQTQDLAKEDPKILMIKKYKDPVFKNVSEFLNAITQDNFRSTVDITTMNYELPMGKKGYTQTAFLLNVNGRFANIIEFIEKIEALPVLVSIDKIKLEINKKDASKVTLNLNGTFYKLESDHG